MNYAEIAQTIGSLYYGSNFVVECLKSYTNHVFRLRFNTRGGASLPTRDKVLKIGKSGLESITLREQQIFRSLLARGFEVPPIEFTQEKIPYEGLVYFITPWVPDRSLNEIYIEDHTKAADTIMRIGSFIRRLSETPAEQVDGALSTTEGRYKELETWTNAISIFEQYKEQVNPSVFQWMHEAREILDQDYTNFVHRDGPQVITDGNRHFAVVDWSLAGAGHPLRSLGIKIGEYLIWMDEPLRSQEWRNWLMSGYFQDSTISLETKKELKLLTIYYMLLITRSNLISGNHSEAQRVIRLIEEEIQ